VFKRAGNFAAIQAISKGKTIWGNTIGLNKNHDGKMTDRKMVFCIITAMLIVAQRAGGKHSAVRNRDEFDPLADYFSVGHLSVFCRLQ
jgi:hypothetical protein